MHPRSFINVNLSDAAAHLSDDDYRTGFRPNDLADSSREIDESEVRPAGGKRKYEYERVKRVRQSKQIPMAIDHGVCIDPPAEVGR